MKGRQSRYVTGGESFAEIARLPSGAVVRLCLNTGLEDALLLLTNHLFTDGGAIHGQHQRR
ncbi:hypothetical protein F9W34_22935 [Salmonella enterica subsp. enterica serovar London]|nr:hypothetical protein [Salmonella enterica subsp. enterica serovar London]